MKLATTGLQPLRPTATSIALSFALAPPFRCIWTLEVIRIARGIALVRRSPVELYNTVVTNETLGQVEVDVFIQIVSLAIRLCTRQEPTGRVLGIDGCTVPAVGFTSRFLHTDHFLTGTRTQTRFRDLATAFRNLTNNKLNESVVMAVRVDRHGGGEDSPRFVGTSDDWLVLRIIELPTTSVVLLRTLQVTAHTSAESESGRLGIVRSPVVAGGSSLRCSPAAAAATFLETGREMPVPIPTVRGIPAFLLIPRLDPIPTFLGTHDPTLARHYTAAVCVHEIYKERCCYHDDDRANHDVVGVGTAGLCAIMSETMIYKRTTKRGLNLGVDRELGT